VINDTAAAWAPPEDEGVLRLSLHGRDLRRPLLLGPQQAGIYATWLRVLNGTGRPYAVGGAYAVYAYTSAWRDSKDLDVFLRPEDLRPALLALQAAGFDTEVRDPLWLAKAHRPPVFMDLLFAVRHTRSLRVTAEWFATSLPVTLLAVPTRLLGIEEVIATKVYLAARDRFDGADICHLIRAAEGRLDWDRLLYLLHHDEEVLLWHLVLFQIVYPGLAGSVPGELMDRAFERLRRARSSPPAPQAFRGMLIDPMTFAVDVMDWGYRDTRDRTPLVDHDGAAL
jgi:hypothetical protein